MKIGIYLDLCKKYELKDDELIMEFDDEPNPFGYGRIVGKTHIYSQKDTESKTKFQDLLVSESGLVALSDGHDIDDLEYDYLLREGLDFSEGNFQVKCIKDFYADKEKRDSGLKRGRFTGEQTND